MKNAFPFWCFGGLHIFFFNQMYTGCPAHRKVPLFAVPHSVLGKVTGKKVTERYKKKKNWKKSLGQKI